MSDVSLLAFFKSLPAGIWCFLGLEEMLWFGKFAVDLRTRPLVALDFRFPFIGNVIQSICTCDSRSLRSATCSQLGLCYALYFGNADVDLQSGGFPRTDVDKS